MPQEARSSLILAHFADLPDPRIDRTKRHRLLDILVIAICATIAGAEDFVSIAEFGRAKEAWFRTFLALPNGIPSHDTFTRLFAALDPEAFRKAFMGWVDALRSLKPAAPTQDHVVSFDGKTLCNTFDTFLGQRPIHIVSAWASSARLVLGQMKVPDKKSETTAIPELLSLLALGGAIVTMDALGCQKEIARKVKEQEADYVLALKENQPSLHQAAKLLFEHAAEHRFEEFPYRHDFAETLDGPEHGRLETRRCCVIELKPDLAWQDEMNTWPGLRSLVRIQSTRMTHKGTSTQVRYYISSLAGRRATAKRLLRLVRTHWHIESRLHWMLDVAFGEDRSRTRRGSAPENLAVVRHIALNLLQHETTAGIGVKNRRLKAGWDADYLLKVLLG